MPRRSDEWASAAAMWITAAGWAAAARDRLGAAWVVTPDAVASPETVLEYTNVRRDAASGRSRTSRYLPEMAVTGIKDAQRARSARAYRVDDRSDWAGSDLTFVWQHHDLFHRAGEALARRHHCPLVAYVHAPQVWEAARWGVRRPGWGAIVERYGERPQLLAADVVACVSEEVATEVARFGVPRERVLVSPMAVDAARFSPGVSGADVRRRFALDDAFVIGWTGSFRAFHGLDVAIEAFAQVHRAAPRSRLLLVGDGAERERLEALARSLGLADAIVFTGAVPHTELPRFVGAMDVAVVTARADQDFHYSPLKLREYLAAGCAVVAPRIGDVGRTLTDGADALLYEPGDVARLTEVLLELERDPDLRTRLGAAGRDLVQRSGTWLVQLDHLLVSEPFQAAVERLDDGRSSR